MMITGNVAGSSIYRCLLWGIVVVVEECNIYQQQMGQVGCLLEFVVEDDIADDDDDDDC